MARVTFQPADWFVFFLFGSGILALGFSAKLRDSSIFQFLTAGRSLSLPAFVATLVTVWYGGILGIGESVTYYGIGTWLLFGVPYYVFALLYAFVIARKVRQSDQITIPERIAATWGQTAGLTAAVLIFFLAVPAAHVLMIGTLLQAVTAIPLLPCVLIATLIGGAFLYKGGLLADVRVGFLAFILMYVGFASMLVFCLSHFDIAAVGRDLDGKQLLNWSGGKGMLVVVTYFILGAWTLVDPGFHQRVTSGKTPQTSRNGVLIAVGFWLLFDVLSIATALFAVSQSHPLPEDGKLLYPMFADQVLPPGLKAIFFCGMIGTILSALVGYTLVGGTTVGREIVGRLKGDIQSVEVTRWSRLAILLSCLLSAFLAINIHSVVSLWYSWGGCIIGALLTPVMLAYLGKTRIPPGVISASMAISFLVSLAWLVYGLQTKNEFLNVAVVTGEGGLSVRSEPEAGEPVKGRTDIPLGTMMPALVVSSAVVGIGVLFRRRKTHG